MDLSRFMTMDIQGVISVRYAPLHFLASKAFWAPQGDKEAVVDEDNNFWIINTYDGIPAQVPYDNFSNSSDLLGWIDSTHLLLGNGLLPPDNFDESNHYTIESLDITTGKVTTIGTLYHSGMPIEYGVISPDSKTVFISDKYQEMQPFNTVIATMNLQTGKITQYPHIEAILQNNEVTNAVWKPGSQEMVLTTGSQTTGDLQTWIAHLDTDTITSLVPGQYATAWNQETNTIITITANIGNAYEQVSDGKTVIDPSTPITISAITLNQYEYPTITTLTKNAYFTSSLGFIPPTQP